MKNVLWLVAVVASGAAGFYLGMGHGAKTVGAIVAQNEVSGGLARIREALNALEKSDLTRQNATLELSFKSALFQIGTYSEGLAHWECTENDRQTIKAANAYAAAKPGLLNGPTQQLEAKGLTFCNARVGV